MRKVEVMWFGQGIDDSWARENNLLPTRACVKYCAPPTALGKKKGPPLRQELGSARTLLKVPNLRQAA